MPIAASYTRKHNIAYAANISCKTCNSKYRHTLKKSLGFITYMARNTPYKLQILAGSCRASDDVVVWQKKTISGCIRVSKTKDRPQKTPSRQICFSHYTSLVQMVIDQNFSYDTTSVDILKRQHTKHFSL